MSDAHAPAPSPDGAAPPPSKLKQMLPVVLALVAGLGAGGGTGKFVVGPALASGIAPSGRGAGHATASDADGDEAAADDEASAADEEGGDDHSGGKDGESSAAAAHTLDNIVLNPAESGGGRFLLLSITFQSPDAAVLDALKARDAELRDVVLVTLGAKTVEQLADMRTREGIKSDLVAATRKLLRKKKAKLHVFFPQFVIQ